MIKKRNKKMISTYEDYVTLLSVYIYTKEKTDTFETELYSPSIELKNSIKRLMAKHDSLSDILDKEIKIEDSFKYLTQYIHTKRFSEERFYKNVKATFELSEKEKEDIVDIVLYISNENNNISINEKDVGKHIAHHLFNKKEYFQALIVKHDIINNLLDTSKYNKRIYYQLYSLACIYIILKDYTVNYEILILNPTQELYNKLEKLFMNVPSLEPIIDKRIVIENAIMILQDCIEKNKMIEGKFFNYLKSLKINLEPLEKEYFLLKILQILSLDGVITHQERIFFQKLSDIIDFKQTSAMKLMNDFKVKKIYKMK
ncbi:MAG: Unknown protein [uncultured Sulfurovum sp.]|uniref:Uncharacterized protein n=1 Tax=uncultured Sulfurovum sp. TaxID=269237 RepID=A0A6S6U8U9_9BACT|nr:MAG: Unknown protein [uncultured Sulfurovum sp.]